MEVQTEAHPDADPLDAIVRFEILGQDLRMMRTFSPCVSDN